MSKIEIGSCCAYCKTCKAFIDGSCKGCRTGYDDGSRDINRAKCKVKVCCIKEKGLATCADCDAFFTCSQLNSWYQKPGYKYGQYKKSADYIRMHGYPTFIRIADKWNNAYGKLY